MPHRRRIRKNSFDGHFDDLVKHFPEQSSKPLEAGETAPKDQRNIHDQLFESAWRGSRAKRRER